MSYHRGGQAGAVAVSYSASQMAPHSPSRRYSSGTSSGSTTTSGIGSSTSKFNAYRSTGGSSILDRSTGFYTSPTSSSLRSNYMSSEYRRSYCTSGRSVSSSSSYGETVGSSSGSSSGLTTTINGTSVGAGKYALSTSSTSVGSSTSSRERSSLDAPSTAADIISRYSPAGYVPNIQRHQQASGSSAHHWRHRSASSSLSELVGGDERELERSRDFRPESSLSSSSSSSSAVASAGLWPRSNKRRPFTSSTVLTSTGHARADSAATFAEVTTAVDDHVTCKLKNDGKTENDDDEDDSNDTKDINGYDDRHNNNGNVGSGRDEHGDDVARRYGVNNNDDERDDDDDVDVDKNEYDDDEDDNNDDDDNLNNRHRHRLHHLHQQRSHRPEEISPIKRNLFSSAAAAAGGGGLIGVSSISLLTNHATNPRNTELLINNNAQDKLTGRKDEENEIATSNEVTRDADGSVPSIDAIAFLQGGRASERDIPENGEEERSASYNSLDEGDFGGVSPLTQNGVAGRSSVTHGDDPSVPSTSRRTDQPSIFSSAASGSANSNPSSSPTNPSTTHQSFYRGVNEQYEGSPTNRAARNRLLTYRDEQCGLNGLRNIGNTCFMNSVIQCLSNTRPLLEYLLNEQYLSDINITTSSMKGALIKAFSQVIHELWEVGGDHVVNTTALKSHIQRFAPRFMGYSQQDAQEFLRYLLEGLHEDVNRVTTKLPPIHGDIPDSYTDMQKAVESWKRYLRSEDSMIVDVFVGQLRSSLHCTSCDHVSVTLDPFWDLSLPIPARSGTVKLSQCLEHFTREEVLDGDEKPTCSKCQMRRKCTKSFSIQKFPKILVIHLKRFSPMERFRGKLNVMVDFPLTGLDLSAFAAPRVPGCTYNLYGVANHSGTTYSGHYTAYCKHPYSGEWHEYNDSRVSVVSARSVVSSEAYVLFYEQQPHSSHL
ncbi:ubiquitin carboxyl-terminal hydrolase 15 isoform X2 [Ooceraea biroi]|nr:ubiquitin carboxyl-terminal hydrolase 15 isoform X2 [Ooceraea biroi]XP_011330317.1 ubiquitin carboxyl-terminal hydrolase 15 isoform X2 [Ooceraea biroi]EZA59491.1 Ubiquitin carboxyl-terminal hydrolase [Ooceraea biroi]